MRFLQKGSKKLKICKMLYFSWKKDLLCLILRCNFSNSQNWKTSFAGHLWSKLPKFLLKTDMKMLSPQCKYAKNTDVENFWRRIMFSAYCFGKVFWKSCFFSKFKSRSKQYCFNHEVTNFEQIVCILINVPQNTPNNP